MQSRRLIKLMKLIRMLKLTLKIYKEDLLTQINEKWRLVRQSID
jgi:hypothetical protein